MVLTSKEPVVPKEFEVPVSDAEEMLVKLLTTWLDGKRVEVLRVLDNYHRGRATVKAMTDMNILGELSRILNVTPLYPRIKGLIDRIVDYGHDSMEEELNMNITMSPGFKRVVEDKSFQSISGMSDDMAVALRESILEGWQNGEGIRELRERVKKEWLDGSVSNARAEMIARTETVYAYNGARLDSARNSGLNMIKEWNAFIDSRTGEDSKKLDGQKRLLDEDFYDEVNDKYIAHSPSRPNCRCRIEFIPIV